jgi:hypothetical protein
MKAKPWFTVRQGSLGSEAGEVHIFLDFLDQENVFAKEFSRVRFVREQFLYGQIWLCILR